MAVSGHRSFADGDVALRRVAADASAPGPWLLKGAARTGESMWFTVADGDAGEAGVLVLVRRGAAADLAYAAATPAPPAEALTPALRLVARHAFADLGLERLETRVRPGDGRLGEALHAAGFTCVGYDRQQRLVWSLVPRDLR